jgi:membrane-anchored glycerophosphoryl diester phosphodiesterase (GDPDase)
MTFTFSIREHIKKAWPMYKANFGLFLMLALITVLVNVIAQNDNIVFGLIVAVASILLSYVWMKSVLHLVDGHGFKPFTKEILPSMGQFWGFIKVNVGVSFFVTIGFLLLVIPGIYVAGRLLFAPYMVIEHNGRARKTIREAWDMTRGHGWQLLWKSILIGIFIFLGVIALGVGILVTYAIGMIVIVMLYREFTKFAKSHHEAQTPHTHVETVVAEKVTENN